MESRVRAAKDETELVHLIANELRKLVAGRQTVVLLVNQKLDTSPLMRIVLAVK